MQSPGHLRFQENGAGANAQRQGVGANETRRPGQDVSHVDDDGDRDIEAAQDGGAGKRFAPILQTGRFSHWATRNSGATTGLADETGSVVALTHSTCPPQPATEILARRGR